MWKTILHKIVMPKY